MKQYRLTALGALLLGATLLISASASMQEFEAVNASPRIREINNTQELEHLMKTEKNLVIKFSTENCKYCVYLDPFFKAAVKAYRGPVIFASVVIPTDVQIRNWYKTTFQFATVPTVVYYRDGQKKHVHGSENATITDKDILNNIAQVYSI